MADTKHETSRSRREEQEAEEARSHRETSASGGSQAKVDKMRAHPEATVASGGVQRIFQAVRDFTDLHGCGWGRNSLVPVPDEDVEELLARGDIRIYEGPVFGDHLGEPVAPNAQPYAPYFGVKAVPTQPVSAAPHKAS